MQKIHFMSIGAFWYRISDSTNIYTTIRTHTFTYNFEQAEKNYNWLYKYVLVDDGCVTFMLYTLIWTFTNHKTILSSTYLQGENFKKKYNPSFTTVDYLLELFHYSWKSQRTRSEAEQGNSSWHGTVSMYCL